MRVIILFSVCLLATFSSLRAQSDKISLYSDPAHTSTQAVDQSAGTLTVYVVHESLAGGTAAYFKIASSAGFTGIWLSETSGFPTMGTSPDGIVFSFPGCVFTARVLEVQYSLLGTSEPCSALDVVANPDLDLFGGAPMISDCVFELRPAIGGRLVVNPNAQCSPVPVSATTWGKVKALYQ